MRNLEELNQYRKLGHPGGRGNHENGLFEVPYLSNKLRVIASSGVGWDHVSVSLPNRAPNWGEMSHIHRLFFRPDEVAMQLHVPATDHINVHPYCLHLWRPHQETIPLPPKWMVG